MIFLGGLGLMDKHDLARLLVIAEMSHLGPALSGQLRTVTSRTLAWIHKRRSLLASTGSKCQHGITPFPDNRLELRIEELASALNEHELRTRIYAQMCRLVGKPLPRKLIEETASNKRHRRFAIKRPRKGMVQEEVDLEALAHAAILLAAEFRGIETRGRDIVTIEHELVSRELQHILDELEQILDRNPEAEREWDRQLQQILDNLPESDRHRLGLQPDGNRIDTRILIATIRKGIATAGSLLLLSGTGFNAYLALSLLIKSASLLAATTFPFAIYMGASSALSLVLTPTAATLLGGIAMAPSLLRIHKTLKYRGVTTIIVQCHLTLLRQERPNMVL